MKYKKYFFPSALTGLFLLLIILSVPKGYFYGSYTDWLSQHVQLAETIRCACIEQNTLVPAFLPLGVGSNGYQFSYYGYLRPDILIGCLFPSVPMVYFIIGYMLSGYLCSVLLCYYWLCHHVKDRFPAFLGSVLFLTAGCFFQTHRQIMFVNYMPFLMLSFLCIKKKRFQLLSLCLFMIYLNSFYYSIACLAAIGWYWMRQDGKDFWKKGLFCYLKSTLLSIGMAALLLFPTALVILEHLRTSQSPSMMELFFSGADFQSLLYSPYGMGLTAICLYMLLLGLTKKKYRADSIMLLAISLCSLAAWILNATLYARAKILIPFVPLIILLSTELLKELKTKSMKWQLWPCLCLIPLLMLKRSQNNFYWILADALVLFVVVAIQKLACNRNLLYGWGQLLLCMTLCIMPCLLFYHTSQREKYVKKADVFSAESFPGNVPSGLESTLYRQDNLVNILASGNFSYSEELSKSAMYSSIYNADYSHVYYDILQTPVQINNRLAILPSTNPFLLNFLGIRYLNTDTTHIPDGYHKVAETNPFTQQLNNNQVLVENETVLPIAYVTTASINESQFQAMNAYEQLDAITRLTIIPDGSTNGSTNSRFTSQMISYTPEFETNSIPESVRIKKTSEGLLLKVTKESTVSMNLKEPLKNQILLLDFKVVNKSSPAVIIDINHMRNKLSGKTAPYPNGNRTFHYQFSEGSPDGLQTLNITLSKGCYLLKDFNWHTYKKQLFSQKQYTTVENLPLEQNEILSCKTNANAGNYFVTSIPIQNGLEILVDGKFVPVLKMNEAFAGAKISNGAHDISVRFRPPGQTAGFHITISCWLIYIYSLARVPATSFFYSLSKTRRKKRRCT